MTIQELKAQAYDSLAQIQFFEKQLQDLNNQIAQAVQNQQAQEKVPAAPAETPAPAVEQPTT